MNSMKNKLRIGILLDSFVLPSWYDHVFQSIQNSHFAKIELIILNDSAKLEQSTPPKHARNYNLLLYTLLKSLENSKSKSNPFTLTDTSVLLKNIPTLTVSPIKSKFSDTLSENDISEIKKYEIDILFTAGFRILRGDILNCSKYGVWSYHHGDNDTNRGGPPALWEVLLNQPITGSIIQILNEDLDGGKTLYKSYSTTNTYSINKNKNELYWKSSSFFARCVQELFELGADTFFKNIEHKNSLPNFYDSKMYSTPTNKELLPLFFKYYFKKFLHKIDSKFYFNQWTLMFYFGKDLQKSFWRYKPLIPSKDRFWAKPFVFFQDGHYYVFLEEYLYSKSKGHISVIEFEPPNNFEKPVIVLEKSFHLSHPFVFEYENELYMIPETQEKRSIQLYKCIDFPEKWEFQKNLLTNIDAVDSTIFNYKNKWWMFSGVKNNEKCDWNDLHIFYTDNPICDNWVPHPMNPITTDIKNSRPAGNIFLENDIIFRPGQISSSEEYGKGIAINRVSILNDKNYEEEIVDKIESWDKNVLGVHTLNRVNGLTVLDAKWKRKK